MSKEKKEVVKQKKALLFRFGGIGDMAPCQVVGQQLKKKGYHVTFAVRYDNDNMRIADVFKDNPAFDELLDYRQLGPWATRCVKTQFGWASINTIFKDFDLVLDYMNIIESNNTSPVCKQGVGEEWQQSRSSNWTNWYDLHLAWANIDPATVPEEEKRPYFSLTKDEEKFFEGIRSKYDKVFTVQTGASSLVRTWYQGEKLVTALLKEYPNSVVFYWDAKKSVWLACTPSESSQVQIPHASPLRVSMGLIWASDVFVGADTGFTHIAEGLGVKHVALYSTVPAWTRAKYYKHQFPIDPGTTNPEYYTFNLSLGDPLRVLEGRENLSEREKLILSLTTKNIKPEQAAEILGTNDEGAMMELKSLEVKMQSFERQQSKALASVTVEQVFNKVKEALDAK